MLSDDTVQETRIKYNFPQKVIKLPQLDEKFDKPIRVKSFSDPRILYEVNLFTYSCTCPDFEDHRKNYSLDELERLCKHQIKVLRENKKAQTHFDKIDFAYISKYRNKTAYKYTSIELQNGETIGLVWSLNNEWIDILEVDKSGVVQKYGYNIYEKRWSYGNAPNNGPIITNILKVK